MRTLNLGILAHVDAGKTSLTERLLFDAGVIDKLGSVDSGNTQTDSLELERQRGITIKAAVVSFNIRGTIVNLIDTPGHPDFIAEVERVLGLLDAAVVVVSAVEGIQAQTRVLIRALRRLAVPFVFFVNKVDRVGAQYDRVFEAIETEMSLRPIAMSSVLHPGSKAAQVEALDLRSEGGRIAICNVLCEADDELLADYIHAADTLTAERLRLVLRTQVAKGMVQPVFGGAAITGVGVPALMDAIATIMPSRQPDPNGPVVGDVFKIERGWGGEKQCYISLTSGTVEARQYVQLPKGLSRVTGIHVFESGQTRPATSFRAGQIARVSGLHEARIGDVLGSGSQASRESLFSPPTLETRILSRRPSENAALWLALGQMAEQDPLINLRKNEETGQLFVSLYGEVQKEVIHSTLLADFGLDAVFEETTIICVETLIGCGNGLEVMLKEPNPFMATIGLSVEPRPRSEGNLFSVEMDVGQMPTSFYRAIEESASIALKEGVYGWQIIDCHVKLTSARHSSADSTAADFRHLTPLVLAAALSEAGTVVCEPIESFSLEAPAACLNSLLAMLAKSGAVMTETMIVDGIARLAGSLASAKIQNVQQQIPGLTSGAGSMESAFDHYAPINGATPMRARSGPDPFNRAEYLLRLRRSIGAGGASND
ncbi:GTP-binding protein [Dongia sp.]|uniref:GTP-binding protein n=1 Tax=Dongia sp. TaxID=1977262 RepID=UPI0035AEC867